MNDASLTLPTAAAIVRAHLELSFPRSCSSCARSFASLADYLRNTTHIDAPVSYDDPAEAIPASPVGTLALANCTCGTTLALGSFGMPVETLMRLMVWARGQVESRGVPIRTVLLELRDEIDRGALAE